MSDIVSGIFILFIAVYIVSFYRRKRQESGYITTKSGMLYEYLLGNDLPTDGSTFNGIQITLHKTFPHIFLDSHHGSPLRGPKRTYKNTQQLNLEGDFNKYFQLFAEEKYRILTLSILTPDVLQKLITDSSKYDVEIKHKKLNLITLENIRLQSVNSAQLMNAATCLLEEIEHKSKSWTAENESESSRSLLQSYNEESVKILGKYYGIGRVAIVVSIFLATYLYLSAYVFWGKEEAEPFVTLGLAILAFPGFPAAMYYMRLR